jgi:O-antigen biosynthesis protein
MTEAMPLISCIMPTRDRPAFVAQSLLYFQSQDYPHKELIIVDGSERDDTDLYEDMADVYYTRISEPHTLGDARNKACALSYGSIICHWDDDDYYGPRRLSIQVQPILNNLADVTGLRMEHMFDVSQGRAFRCSDEQHACLFPGDVRAGTLMYKVSYWLTGLRYARLRVGEDIQFLQDILRTGARLVQVRDAASYTCIRHTRNVTPALDVTGWEPVELDACIPYEYQGFYRGLHAGYQEAHR